MKKLRPSYEIIGEREASLDSLQEEIQTFNFTNEYEKLKKTSLSLSTFSIFMMSFNLTTPLTISTGVASISIGNLTLFFVLLLIYQLYILKCLKDEFSLFIENHTGSLKQNYYFFLLCRRAEMKLKTYNLVPNNSEIEFTMHGIEIDQKMYHAPAILYEFASEEDLQHWQKILNTDFSIRKQIHSKWYVYLSDSKINQDDINYWHENKKRIYTKRKRVHNHYYIPIFYSILGLLSTLLLIFPTIREWLISLFLIASNFLGK